MNKHIFLVENYPYRIKEAYTNVVKIESEYGFNKWSIYKAIKRCGQYRKNDYIITKLNIL